MGCSNCISGFNYNPPQDINDGLDVGTLWSVKIDTALIAEAVKKIKCGKFNEIHSMLIYKDNMLVLEEYFKELFSCT